MNEQVLAGIRSGLLIVGGMVVSKGVVDQSTMTSIIGGVMSFVPTVWSLWGHRQAGIIASAAALPDVHKIVTTHAIADSPQFAANPAVVSTLGSSMTHD